MRSIDHGVRTRIKRTMVVLVVSVLLSACGTRHQALPPLTLDAVPSSSIATPLLVSGCAQQHCWAAGTTTVQGVTTTLVERQTLAGQWTPVASPVATGTISALACSDTTCFIGGTANGQDLLWAAPTATSTLAPVPIADGTGIAALSCTATFCAGVDHTATGTVRLVDLADASSTTVTGLAAHDTLTALSCASATECWIGATTSAGAAVLLATTDGVSWLPVTTPSWVSVLSLSCTTTCVGLVQDASSQYIARQTNQGWHSDRVPFVASAMSCASAGVCVVVGQHATGEGAAELWRSGQIQPTIIHYAPTPFMAVGCSATDCAAVGATTLLSLRP